MNKHVREIANTFHHNNHIKVKNVCKTKSFDYKIVTELPDENGIITIKNKLPGVYMVYIDKKGYMFNLCDALIGNDCVVIKNIYIIYSIIDGKKKHLHLYRASGLDTDKVDDNAIEPVEDYGLSAVLPYNLLVNNTNSYKNSYIIKNTIEGSFDGIAVGGETYLTYEDGEESQSPYHPAAITSVSTINIGTNSTDNRNYKMKIRLNNNIKKLPSGVNDLFVMDSLHQQAYILFRVGRMVLTGNENWQTIIENDKYCIYFIKSSLVSTGEDDTSINCNYFPAITCTKMTSNKTLTYGISNSNDSENTGFYVRIPTDVIESPGVDNFKKYIKSCLRKNPIIIEYLLKDRKYKSILLDNYDIKQFYPITKLSIEQSLNIMCFCKVLHYEIAESKYNVLQISI